MITPKSNYDKIVIIVPGSGKDTRNSHFLLTQQLDNNIAVFRYDERGVGLSEGKYGSQTYTISNMINDLAYVYNYLKTDTIFVSKKIELLGHSQGGLVTIGSIEKGLKCDFLIQWATPIQRTKDFLKYEIKTGVNKQEKTLNYSNDEMKFTVMDSIQKIIDNNIIQDNLTFINNVVKHDTYPFYLDLLRKNYTSTYKNIDIPTLYIIGDNDIYVDPNENINLLKTFNNEKISYKVFKTLNHYLNQYDLKQANATMYEIDTDAKVFISNWITNNCQF